MSSFNYMDNVPVKISENYKPPPRVYQLPQAIQNRLALQSDHYEQSPQYNYDFQLERKVLAKIPEWQRMRQQEREARRERKERREQQRQLEVEAQHRQLLGAVSYPNAAELSSSGSEDEETPEITSAPTATVAVPSTNETTGNTVVSTQTNSFHNILQPTILSYSNVESSTAKETNRVMNEGGKRLVSSAFNYKDFENDTSSPFDNIELKTINDLDILAQVLHNTQLKANTERASSEEQEATKDDRTQTENVENSNVITKDEQPPVENAYGEHAIMENTKAALEKIDFNGLTQQLHHENIPNISAPTTNAVQIQQQMSNNYSYQRLPAFAAFMPQQQQQQQQLQQSQQQSVFVGYHMYNGIESSQQPQTIHALLNANNYSGHCNGLDGGAQGVTNYYNPQYLGQNANTYYPGDISSNSQMILPQAGTLTSAGVAAVAETGSKSKSVPDILKELSEEVRNSEMRRTRNYSHNTKTNNAETDTPTDDEKTLNNKALTYAAAKHLTPTRCPYYARLEEPAQKLAKNISSMGFPLERVAKITQMFGADDKKIIEHLIPLSELMDLGFEETKISEALVKFDNNREKALEYLIS